MKKIQKGFTLIELMIVVAIIGILAAVAIPAYQDYIVKAKLSKVANSLDSIKLAAATYYQSYSSFPVAAAVALVGSGGTNTTATATGDLWWSLGFATVPVVPVEIATLNVTGTADNFPIVLTFAGIKASTSGGAIDGATLTMTGTPASNAMVWVNTSVATNIILKKYFNF